MCEIHREDISKRGKDKKEIQRRKSAGAQGRVLREPLVYDNETY